MTALRFDFFKGDLWKAYSPVNRTGSSQRAHSARGEIIVDLDHTSMVQFDKYRLSWDRDKSAISGFLSVRKRECHSIRDLIGCLMKIKHVDLPHTSDGTVHPHRNSSDQTQSKDCA